MLTKSELNRYTRQLILEEIGIEGQEKLKKAAVRVIGAGGLGCPVLQYLTAIGVGKIGIVDNDHVEETNFQRQILYGIDDLGKPKVETAAKILSKLNPFTEIKSYYVRIDKSNIDEIAKDYDIIAGCPDNFFTRVIIDDICRKNKKPFVFAAVSQFTGQVSVFNYRTG